MKTFFENFNGECLNIFLHYKLSHWKLIFLCINLHLSCFSTISFPIGQLFPIRKCWIVFCFPNGKKFPDREAASWSRQSSKHCWWGEGHSSIILSPIEQNSFFCSQLFNSGSLLSINCSKPFINSEMFQPERREKQEISQWGRGADFWLSERINVAIWIKNHLLNITRFLTDFSNHCHNRTFKLFQKILESDLDSNHMGTDSSFDASTSTKIDYRNFRVEPYAEEFPWLLQCFREGIQV